jgi:hypothetical protein
MRVIISGSVIDAVGSTADVWKLHKLLTLACEGRHAVLVDSPVSLNAWLGTIDSTTKSTYASALDFCARQAVTFPDDVATIHILPTVNSSWTDPLARLTLDDALSVLSEPLGILLENAENDWHFLCGIMRPSERERIQWAVKKSWAEPIHGGGSTLIKQLAARANISAKGLRTFVMFDSDRLHPDECAATWTPNRPGRNPVACQAFDWEQVVQQQLPQRYWMLRRRFIESYMPQTELNRASSQNTHSNAVAAFTRLSKAGRWYFNMKKGFAGDEKRDDKERCGDLYTPVNPNDRDALKNGFGSNLADHYITATTNEFNWDEDARQEAERALPKLMRLL